MEARTHHLRQLYGDLADQTLGQKGFAKVAEKSNVFIFMTSEPDLRFKMFEPEIGYPQSTHQLRMLTLNIYTTDKKKLVRWGGGIGECCHGRSFRGFEARSAGHSF